MGATPARIGFVLQGVRAATAEAPEIAARHGKLARRDEVPVETFFDSLEDAEAIATARQALMGTERRRFEVTVKGLEEALALSTSGPAIPQARYVDPDHAVDIDALVAEVGFDFATQRSTFVVWG